MNAEIIKLARRRGWVVVVDHGTHGGFGRKGYWCEDAQGGWGTSKSSAWGAVEGCAEPKRYMRLKDAKYAAKEIEE